MSFGENDRECTEFVMSAAWPGGGVTGTCWPIVEVHGWNVDGEYVVEEARMVSALTEDEAIAKAAERCGIVEVGDGRCLTAR